MRKISVNTFLTLDGVMQAPGAPEEDRSGGFTHGGWSVNYWDDMMSQKMDAYMSRSYELLLGRKTYEIFAAYWPHRQEEPGPTFTRVTKYVASRTLKQLEWHNSQLLRGDVGHAVADLKRDDGPELQVHGSADLIQTLLQHNLIDEFNIWIFPLVLGTGKRLFGSGTIPAGLRQTAATISTTGVMIATYEPAGAIEYGSFADEEPSDEEIERRKKID